MTKIGTIWRETFRRYWRTMVIFAIINVVIWFVVLALVKFNAFGLHDLALKSIKANFVNDASSHKINHSGAFGGFVQLTWHNYLGGLATVAISLIPIPFWWVTAVMNPASIGYLLGLSPIPVTTFFAGIFPHSIVEMPMQWLEFSIAWETFRLIWQNIRTKQGWWHGVDRRRIITILIVVVLPMAIVAGAIESFITPALLNMAK